MLPDIPDITSQVQEAGVYSSAPAKVGDGDEDLEHVGHDVQHVPDAQPALRAVLRQRARLRRI